MRESDRVGSIQPQTVMPAKACIRRQAGLRSLFQETPEDSAPGRCVDSGLGRDGFGP